MSQHVWIRSTLGHGDMMCKHCLMTSAEATVLGMECTKAPVPEVQVERDTCEVCDHDHKSQCRYCGLSGEPNPEAFTRQELVEALLLSYKKPAS